MKELKKELGEKENEDLYLGKSIKGTQISFWIDKEEKKIYIQDDDKMKGVDNISFELIKELASIIK